MRRLGLLLPFLLVSPVSAANVTQKVLIEQNGYIPSWLFLFVASVAISALIVGYRYKDDMCSLIAIMFSFISMWTSRAIDSVTGVGIDTTSTITVVHTIYHTEIITVACLVLFILSLLNGYLVYTLSKRSALE